VRRVRTTTCVRSHTPALSSTNLVTYVHIFFVHYLINVSCIREPQGIHAISWVGLSLPLPTVLPKPAAHARDDEKQLYVRHPTRVAQLQPLAIQHRHDDGYGG